MGEIAIYQYTDCPNHIDPTNYLKDGHLDRSLYNRQIILKNGYFDLLIERLAREEKYNPIYLNLTPSDILNINELNKDIRYKIESIANDIVTTNLKPLYNTNFNIFKRHIDIIECDDILIDAIESTLNCSLEFYGLYYLVTPEQVSLLKDSVIKHIKNAENNQTASYIINYFKSIYKNSIKPLNDNVYYIIETL